MVYNTQENLDSDLDKQSKYNSGLNKIQRLSYLKNLAHAYAEKKDWENYEIILDRFWIELASDSKESEKIEEIKKEIAKIKQIKTGFKSNEMDYDDLLPDHLEVFRRVNYKLTKLKKVLEKYDILLRTLENAQGLGTAYRNESEEGIE